MKKLLTVTSVLAIAAAAVASGYDDMDSRNATPFEIDLVSPLKVWPHDRDVMGLRLNLIYGHSLSIYGVDLGVIGANKGDVAGLQVNGFDWTDGSVYGLQVGAVGNYATDGFAGIQFGGLLSWDAGDSCGLQVSALNFTAALNGLQLGALNWCSGSFDGIQIGVANVEKYDAVGAAFGVFNFCHGDLAGGQIGVFNSVAGNGTGFQLGVVNSAKHLTGVQIGIMNINEMGAWPVMVIANASF